MKYYLLIIFKEKSQVTYLARAIYQEKIDSWNRQLIPNPYILGLENASFFTLFSPFQTQTPSISGLRKLIDALHSIQCFSC